MAVKRKGLGRGLDALLGSALTAAVPEAGQPAAAPAAPAVEPGSGREGELRVLPIDLVQPGRYQPRQAIQPEALQELADSIRAQGVVQPVVVRPVADGRYELIAGERRWRAAQMAGRHEIPAVVRTVDDQAAMAMALIENIQREDLNPLEEARALYRLIEEFGLTHQETAQAVGRSRTAVSNLLRLLDLMPEVKALLEQGQLEMGHARALLALDGESQVEAARTLVARGFSVRETERWVKRLLAGAGPAPRARQRRPDPDVARLEQRLSDRLGALVRLRQGRKGKGEIIIGYNSLDELEGILARLPGGEETS